MLVLAVHRSRHRYLGNRASHARRYDLAVRRQALTLAMCPLSRMPFCGCRASSGHHNIYSTGPRGQCFLFLFFLIFFSASYAAMIFTGNRQNSEGNVNSYLFFVLYIGLMYKSVQLYA